MRILRSNGPWVGSALVHAVLIMLLALWTFQLRGRGPSPALTALSTDPLGQPELLDADKPPETAESFLTSFELVSLEPHVLDTAPQLSGPTLLATSLVGSSLSGQKLAKGGWSVAFFGSVASGKRIVFVLDISGSMSMRAGPRSGPTRFDRAKQELLAAIDRFYEDQRFAVLLFSDKCRPMFDEPLTEDDLLPATPQNKQRLADWLQAVYPVGATDPRQAIQAALSVYPDAVFLLSDGEFKIHLGRQRHRLGGKTIRLIRRINANDVPIHTIAYQDRRNRQTLQQIAEESGGTYRFVP